MPLPLYLAMTAAEISNFSLLPRNFAYMACHFSPYSTGLSNLPTQIPADSMLIINDRIPVFRHDPGLIKAQLEEILAQQADLRLLLDLQRSDNPLTAQIVRQLVSLSCPVAVTEQYAENFDCPVFVHVPVYRPMEQHIQKWEGRTLWLEVITEHTCVTISQEGMHITPEQTAHYPCWDEQLVCHYCPQARNHHVRFYFRRDEQDIQPLLAQAAKLGFTCAVGLWQQLRNNGCSA